MLSAVVLAAGASTRMGRHKLLLPLGHEPIVRWTVRHICDAGFDDVLVVLGHAHDQVAAAIAGMPARHVVNPDYASGMGSSFRTAVEHLDGSEAAVFALADQPFVTAAEYRRLIDAYRQPSAPGIVSVRYGGPKEGVAATPKEGVAATGVIAPPHLFARKFFPELAALEHGARPVLLKHAADTAILQFAAELLMDIDTPEDYERASRRVTPRSG